MAATRLLVFGGCNIRGPLYRAARLWDPEEPVDWGAVPSDIDIAGPHFFTFTVGEMLQALQGWRGERTIPEELRHFCHMRPLAAPTPRNNPLDRSDIALVEPNTSVEIVYDGYFLNRGPFVQFLEPLRGINAKIKRLYFHWYGKGIVAADDPVRRDLAEDLISEIPSDTPDRDLTVELIRGARGNRRDIHEGMGQLAAELAMPVGIVTFTWSYMPDGRAISWPAEFHDEVVAAAHALGLPLYEPHELVRATGLGQALKPDLRHYTEQFQPVLAMELINFARRVGADATAQRT